MKGQNDSLQWRLTLTIIKKQGLGAEIQMVVMDSFDNYLTFDQCDCSGSNACKLANDTRPDIDIGKLIEKVDFWTTYGITLPYVIVGFLLLIVMSSPVFLEMVLTLCIINSLISVYISLLLINCLLL